MPRLSLRSRVVSEVQGHVAVARVLADARARSPVDGIMCGHMDLRFDLGLGYGGPMQEPEYVGAVTNILAAAKKAGDKPVLTFAKGAQAQEQLLSMGFRLLMVGSDGFDLAAGMRTELKNAHETVLKVQGSKK